MIKFQPTFFALLLSTSKQLLANKADTRDIIIILLLQKYAFSCENRVFTVEPIKKINSWMTKCLLKRF